MRSSTFCAALSLLAAMGGCNSTTTWSVRRVEPATPEAKPSAGEIMAAASPPANVPSPTPAPAALETYNVARVSFADEGADFDPAVSADGRTIAFASTRHHATSDIYTKPVDSRLVTRITNHPADDAMPAISPDGSTIAFASNRTGNWDIYLMAITGGPAVQLTDDAADETHPSWSADGRTLVFNRNNAGRWEMWTIAARNPAVANFIGYGLLPKWCPVPGPNADRILFQQTRERGARTFGIWTLDVTEGKAGNATEIASSPTSAFINPTWSPDGNWIACAEVPAGPAGVRAPNGTLWLLAAAGDARVQLTSGTGVNLSPAWSADNRLFFVSNRAGADNIWVMDMAPALRAAASGSSPAPTQSTSASTQADPVHSTDNNPVASVIQDPAADPR